MLLCLLIKALVGSVFLQGWIYLVMFLLLRKLRTFLLMPLWKKALAFEILFFLIIAKLMVKCLPFRWYAKRLGKRYSETLSVRLLSHRPLLVYLRVIIPKIGDLVPWRSVCLDQALAGYIMLKRRGLPTTFYFGIHKKADDSFGAHAWLRCGRGIITGENGNGMTLVACYASMPKASVGLEYQQEQFE